MCAEWMGRGWGGGGEGGGEMGAHIKTLGSTAMNIALKPSQHQAGISLSDDVSIV